MSEGQATAESVGTAKPPSTWKRPVGVFFLVTFGLSLVANGLMVGAMPAVLLGGLAMALGVFFTARGKAWRMRQRIPLPGWALGLVFVGLLMTAQSFITEKTETNVAQEFAASGPRRMAQAKEALQKGDHETAKALLLPLQGAENETLKALNLAVESVEATKGDVTNAAMRLNRLSKSAEAADKPAYLAAIEQINPKAAAEYAEMRKQEAAEADAQAKVQEVEDAQQKVIEDAKATYGRFFSGWDGSHREMVEAVKANMNDPDSFKHVETTFSDGPGDTLLVNMTYRGRNGFGGVVTERVIGTISALDGHLINVTKVG